MLRGLIGTDAFWTGIREYYGRFKDLNASTGEFRRVMEQVSGRDLGWFFAQWLTRSGVPQLTGSWRYDADARQVLVELAQTQPGPAYRLPIEIALTVPGADGPRIEQIELTATTGGFAIAADAVPTAVTLDPATWLLMAPPEFVARP